MGRIIMVVTVWLVMAAMMLLIALPVIAKNTNQEDGPGGGDGPPRLSGQAKEGTSSWVGHAGGGAVCVTHKGLTTEKTTGGGCQEVT
jgi:hypothetical protein